MSDITELEERIESIESNVSAIAEAVDVEIGDDENDVTWVKVTDDSGTSSYMEYDSFEAHPYDSEHNPFIAFADDYAMTFSEAKTPWKTLKRSDKKYGWNFNSLEVVE